MAMQMVSRAAEASGSSRTRYLHERQAWLLDAAPFHAEFDELFASLADDHGLDRFRRRAADLWRADDAARAGYVSQLRTHTPEEWDRSFAESHLAEWYRVLMADYLVPTVGFAAPAELKDQLPVIGWTASDARRLAWGRELSELAAAYALDETAMALSIVLPVGNKGWHSQDDIAFFLEMFSNMDRRWFRRAQHLIPAVENAYAVLDRAGAEHGRVLILPGV